ILTSIMVLTVFKVQCFQMLNSRMEKGGRYVGGIGGIVFLVLCASLIISPVQFARWLTPFGIACLFFFSVSAILVGLARLESRLKIPFGLLLIACLVIFGEWNDNHRVRSIPDVKEARERRTVRPVSEGFDEWLKSRRDMELYDSYPIYIVAAEGGGIYAA